MKTKLVLAFMVAAACGLWSAGPAQAKGVELWEGESTTVSQSKTQVVRGSATAKSDKPAVATVSKPKGDNLRVTITGVKEGETTVTITGKRVVYNVGVNQKSIRTEEPFTAYIDVVVVKAETVAKLLVLKRREQRTINFPKSLKMLGKSLKNSNKKVCGYNRNTNRKLTVFGKKKGTSTITMELLRTKKGKTKRIRGIIYVEVKGERIKMKDNRTSMGWDDLFKGRIVLLNPDGTEVKDNKPPKKVKEEKNKKYEKYEKYENENKKKSGKNKNKSNNKNKNEKSKGMKMKDYDDSDYDD